MLSVGAGEANFGFEQVSIVSDRYFHISNHFQFRNSRAALNG